MTKQYEDDGGSARLAELELENEELKQRLAQREHDTAVIVDRLEAAQNGVGRPWPSTVYLGLLWLLISARIIGIVMMPGPEESFGLLLVNVFFIGFLFVLAGKWMRAEIGRNAGVGILRSCLLIVGLFVGALIFSGGLMLIGHMGFSYFARGPWTLLWITALCLVLLPQFCEWVKEGVTKFSQRREQGSQELFDQDSYDGRGEN